MPHPKIESKEAVPRKELSIEAHVQGVLARDRVVLGRTITLIESNLREHQVKAQAVLQQLLPHTGRARRVGITGVPGAGKSTFIEALGTRLTAAGHSVAVLAIDPSSRVTGGSILGDKTRMNSLSADPNAFIRPSPSSGTLGGVAQKSRETLLVCEAAGFDVVLVETVGVGQSETVVDEMVDFLLVLAIAGAGDELQGIKRGLLELADLICVNKADGDNLPRVERAQAELRNAVHLLRPKTKEWRTPVLACSSLTGAGLSELWDKIEEHHRKLSGSGELIERRQRQQVRWMWSMIQDGLLDAFKHHPEVVSELSSLEERVKDGQVTAGQAAFELLSRFARPAASGTQP